MFFKSKRLIAVSASDDSLVPQELSDEELAGVVGGVGNVHINNIANGNSIANGATVSPGTSIAPIVSLPISTTI